MKRVSPYLLGICLAYVILGVKQIFSSEILMYKIYYMVSVVSLSVSLTELLKIIYKYLNQCHLNIEELIHLCAMYSKIQDDKLINDIKQNSAFLRFEKEKRSFESSRKKKEVICKITEVLIVLSYVNSVCAIVLIPCINISNNLLTNKISGAATLFCFALMFFTSFLNEYIDKISADFQLKKKEIINGLNDVFTGK